jgi:hypothetical protein
MAILPPIPDPPPVDNRPAWKRYLATYLPWLLTVLATFAASYLGTRPAKVERVEVPPVFLGEADKPLVATFAGYSRPTHGWVKDADVIAENLDPLVTEHFVNTPAGKAVMGDEDVFLWRSIRKVANKGPPWYSNIDQGQVGCCVGAGNKHAADLCLAGAILSGGAFEWKPVSVEVIYGGSRVEIGNGKIRGDGSVGAWAARWLKEYGVVPMESVAGVDLSNYSPARAREYGSRGVPKAVEDVARKFPVKGVALVKTWADVKRAMGQSYPVAVCSDQGFTMQRDSTGSCRASGTWNHCMCIAGYRKLPNGTEQGFILNSWGDHAHGGPVDPPDAPMCGFWADSRTIEGMVRQGDSFALADIVGFPARKIPIDWFIKADVAPARKLLPLFAAFAPELAH